MSGDESSDVQLHQRGVKYTRKAEQVPWLSPEEHRKKQE